MVTVMKRMITRMMLMLMRQVRRSSSKDVEEAMAGGLNKVTPFFNFFQPFFYLFVTFFSCPSSSIPTLVSQSVSSVLLWHNLFPSDQTITSSFLQLWHSWPTWLDSRLWHNLFQSVQCLTQFFTNVVFVEYLVLLLLLFYCCYCFVVDILLLLLFYCCYCFVVDILLLLFYCCYCFVVDILLLLFYCCYSCSCCCHFFNSDNN